MLPTVQVPARRPKPLRPISQNDSAASTGLASNPNGTYIANPFPTTAQNGMQGQFGAMLPSGGNMPTNSPMYNMLTSGGALQPPKPVIPGATYQPQGSGRSGRETLQNPNQNPNMHISPGWMGSGTFTQNAAMQGVLNRLDMGDMSAISQIPKADLEAMGLGDLAAVTGSDPAGEPTDFQKTETYKKNVQNGIPLDRQLRWDEKKRKYITVGQWMRQERKKYNKKGKYVGDKRANQSKSNKPNTPAPKPEEAKDENYHGTIQQLGVVNFNTATG